MSPRRIPGKWVGLAARVSTALLVGVVLRADDEVAKTLALPTSPGAIALLVPHSREEGVSEKLKGALSDPNPDVRAAATRAVNAAAHAELLTEVSAALGKESDAHAAREQIRALLALGGPGHDDEVLAAAARLSPSLDAELVRIVARVRGPAALSLYFSQLWKLSLAPSDREAFFRIACRGHRDSLQAGIALALGRRDTASFAAVTRVATELGLTLDQPVLVEAMRSDQPWFRGEAAWYLARTYCDRPPESAEELLAVATETGPAPPPGSDPELRFGSEMLRRVLGRAPVEDEDWIACLESNLECHLDSDLGESPLIDFLTPREREVVLVRNNEAGRPPELKSEKKSTVEKAQGSDLRLVGGLPRGVAHDLFQMQGCRPSSRLQQIAVAAMRFRSDGLPQNVTILGAPSGKRCDDIARALFTMSLAPDEFLGPDQRVTYLALFDPDLTECGEENSPASKQPGVFNVLRVRAKVEFPKLRHKVEPTYPEVARKNHQEGVSIYEAIITTTGCVQDVRMIRSSAPVLDVVGMEAVSRWKYTPARLNGQPVRVYLTVTVTYKLDR